VDSRWSCSSGSRVRSRRRSSGRPSRHEGVDRRCRHRDPGAHRSTAPTSPDRLRGRRPPHRDRVTARRPVPAHAAGRDER
jgi:hypothetical protein